MRPGSITTTEGRCGNPGCHCRKDGDPGHGPFYRLTRKIEGKTVTETFPTPLALRKAQGEVAEFQRFREKLDLSPDVRRMLAVVGSEAPFDQGRRRWSCRQV
jgi:hypothetical protein